MLAKACDSPEPMLPHVDSMLRICMRKRPSFSTVQSFNLVYPRRVLYYESKRLP